MSYAKPVIGRKTEFINRGLPPSEYPWRVLAYQFKDLEDARRFARDLPGQEVKVEMFHRTLEERKSITDEKGETTSIVNSILLDVTRDSPEEAERKWNQKVSREDTQRISTNTSADGREGK